MKEIKNNEKEIITNITNTILKYYPKIKRDELVFTSPQTQIDIIIQYMNVDGKDYTMVYFCNGTIYVRNSIDIPERFLIEGLISPSTINELIFNMLEDYDYFRSVSLEYDSIEITLGLDLKYGQRYGISCNRINFKLEFCNYYDKERLMNEYMNEIIKVYAEEIDRAPVISDRLEYKLKMHN